MDPSSILHKYGGRLKLSATFCRAFVTRYLMWSYRVPTSAAQKLPHDWEWQGELMILRASFIANRKNIHPSLIINWDQTGMYCIPTGGHRTYAAKGAKEVRAIGQDDKAMLTMVVGSSLTGMFLPPQLIFD